MLKNTVNHLTMSLAASTLRRLLTSTCVRVHLAKAISGPEEPPSSHAVFLPSSTPVPIGVIARKIGMSRIFQDTGASVPVTYLQVDDNTVVRTKTKEKDGYDAIVLGIDEDMVRTRKGKEHKTMRNQKEFQVDSLDGLSAGSKVTSAVVPAGSLVTIVSVSKGKGFQGVMKRHHFSGGPRSHGSHFKREPGSVGMRTWPGRIHPGKRMPGRMGGEKITVKHRSVVAIDEAQKLIAIRGPIPGPDGSIVYVTVEPTPTKTPVAKK